MSGTLNLAFTRFAPARETVFQESYYLRVRPTLRVVSGLLATAITLYSLLGLSEVMAFVSTFSLPQLVWCLVIFGLTWVPAFGRVWQTVTVLTGWLTAGLMFGLLASAMIAHPPPFSDAEAVKVIQRLSFTLHLSVFMVTTAAFRLQFAPALALQGGVALVGTWVFMTSIAVGAEQRSVVLWFLEPTMLVLLAVLLAAFVQEKLARGAFELQEQEHEKHEKAERMLHVLNGTIGSITHDLGSPLVSVQNGSELLERILDETNPDVSLLHELNGIVLRGAKMLSFLRLSLIEQTRVLEGQPVPVELKPVAVRAVVEAGASFQAPRFLQGRSVTLEGEDTVLCADEMKMVTVVMNLIGNALKYSDGQVCVTWRVDGNMLLLAVLDAGKAGCGITQEQASRLFIPFGRLETHQSIEGTGLGVLSVQKIAEAHQGRAWIEGFTDGTPDSLRFSTGGEPDPALLCPPFRTAFMVICPVVSRHNP